MSTEYCAVPDILRSSCSDEAPALLAPGFSSLNHRELFATVTKVVDELNGFGIGHGDRVGIVLPTGISMAIALLCVMSAAEAAPLNPAFLSAEFEFYLKNLRVTALLVEGNAPSAAVEAAERLGISVLRWNCGQDLKCRVDLASQHAVAARGSGFATSEHLALVLHTSGTTARPKIVPLQHGRLCMTAMNISYALELKKDDRALNVMPLFHVHGILNSLLSSLAASASVVCAPGFNPTRFSQLLEDFQITWFSAVPTIHHSIVRLAVGAATTRPRRLRFVRSSSAPLPLTLANSVEKLFGVPVIESYGMTEVDQITTNRLDPLRRKPGSVGQPGGCEVRIVDTTGRPLPTRTPGEVVVRGGNVMTAYEGDPIANSNCFFGEYFRTGDQGYFDEDGFLFLTGRIKEIINRGGEKVSPREVDEVLLSCEGVCEAAVFAIPHPHLGEEIGALIVRESDAAVTAENIQAFAATRLSEFKIPRRFFFVRELPRGPTGKLQRSDLAKRLGLLSFYQACPEKEQTMVLPSDSLELEIQRAWQEVIGIEPISTTDNFLDIGGSSLLSAQLYCNLEGRFGITMPLSLVLECSTIREMARILRASESTRSPAA